jgi:arginase
MNKKSIILVGAPVDSGKARKGCVMGPDAYRTARLGPELMRLGYTVIDLGNVQTNPIPATGLPAHLNEPELTLGWTHSLADMGEHAFNLGMPVFLGGDHSLSLGSGLSAIRHATREQRPLFVLWLDAHSDFHTPQSTQSGNLHGTPLAYLTGRDGFYNFPTIPRPLPQENICILGLRSVDDAERTALQDSAITYHDMRDIDENGIAAPLKQFLDRVRVANGLLHVSLDVDFLDPSIAPAVGTTVPGGATLREAHLVMEILHDSSLMTSLDLVELNPFLDERGRTAQVMVDLTASALGRRVFDRPTQQFFS